MIITPVRRAVGTGVAIVVLVVIIYLIMQGFDRGENMVAYRMDSLSIGSQFTKETVTLMPMITGQPSRPPVLFLTYRSRAEVPDYVWERFAKYTKGYTIEFFDDTRCRLSLYPFGPTVMKKFDSLRGAHKADLWRYCMMYVGRQLTRHSFALSGVTTTSCGTKPGEERFRAQTLVVVTATFG